MRHAEFLVLQHRVWAALRRGDRLTVAAASERFGYKPKLVSRYLRALVAEGWVARERSLAEPGQPATFWLLEDLGPLPPQFAPGRVLVNPNLAGQVADPHQRLWNALRIQRRGRWADFSAPAEVCRRTTVVYLSALRGVGYVQAVRSAGREGWLVWSLARDTGPIAPVVLADGVFDPNLDLLLEVKDGTESTESEEGQELWPSLDSRGEQGAG